MHSYTLPIRCLSVLGLSLLLGGAAVCGYNVSCHLDLADTPPSSWDKQCPDSAS